MPIAKPIAPSSPRWATSRSGTIFSEWPSGVSPLGRFDSA
jgi:hypothetical protein